MTNTAKFLTALSVGGVLISSASGLMIVNAQSATTASAATSQNTNYNRSADRDQFKSQIDAVKTAIENKDYTAWKSAIATAPNGTDQLAKIDTQAKFDQLVQAHEYLKANEPDKAKAIIDTLGIQLPGKNLGGLRGKMGDLKQNPNAKAVRDALDSGDYEAWKTAIASTPKGSEILAKVDTQEKFTQLSDAHKALRAAHETKQKVQTDLGLDGLMGKGKGMKKNMDK